MSDQTTPEAILQLGFGFWGSKTLLSAVELGVFSALAPGPLDAQTLMAPSGAPSTECPRLLGCPRGIAPPRAERTQYANTPATDLFLDRAKPSYIGGLLEMVNQRLYPFWGALTDGVAHRPTAK